MQSYSLLEFNQLVKSVLDKNLEKSYWIVGEIGEMNINRSGHCYLDLIEKEDNVIVAKTRATIWAYTYSSLSNWFTSMTGTELKPGMKVLVNAAVQFHEVYGFSLNVKDIDPNFTLGERERKRQETINRLESEGIIDMNKSVPLPLVPQRIAVISSETAAGYGDFHHQLMHNQYGYSVLCTLYNATMQGESASESIIQAMHRIFERETEFDAMAIIRGGGAKTDLDCFDDYDLCAHIAQFPLPVITGIGHERDSTIADLVANTKMKTPTAVAEFIIGGMAEFELKIDELFSSIKNYSSEVIRESSDHIQSLEYRLNLSMQDSIHNALVKLSRFEESIRQLPAKLIDDEMHQLDLLHSRVSASDPQLILNKGFTITKINGQELSESRMLKKGAVVETIHKDGNFESIITTDL